MLISARVKKTARFLCIFNLFYSSISYSSIKLRDTVSSFTGV